MDIANHEHEWLTCEGAAVMRQLGVQNGDAAIDFGCGQGRYTIPLSQALGKSGKVIAVERNTTELDLLRERVSAFPTQATIKTIHTSDISLESIQDNTIDAFLAFDVLQYVADWPRLFNTAHRVLKNTGVIHIYPAAVPHPDAVDVQRLTKVLAAANFVPATKRRFMMMHNKHMVTDIIHSFQPTPP